MARARQVVQKGLSEDDKCEGGICKSTDTRWTEICKKHQKEIDEVRARWHHSHEHGLGTPLTGAELDRYNEEHK